VPEMRILEVSAKKVAQEEQNIQPLKDPWVPDEAQQLTRSDKNKKKVKGSAVLYYNMAIAALLLVVIVAFMTFGAKSNEDSSSASVDKIKSENQTLKSKLAELEAAQDVAYEKITLLETDNKTLSEQLADQSDQGTKPATETEKPPQTTKPTETTNPTQAVKPVTPVQPAKPSLPAAHRVAKGENLFRIAEKYYGDKSKWLKICDANNDRLIGIDARNQEQPCSYLPLGTSLTIPR
jgi:nucleoid-associated protein YgaU